MKEARVALALLIAITGAAVVCASVATTSIFTTRTTSSLTTIILCNYTLPTPSTIIVGNYTIMTASTTSQSIPAPALLALLGGALLGKRRRR